MFMLPLEIEAAISQRKLSIKKRMCAYIALPLHTVCHTHTHIHTTSAKIKSQQYHSQPYHWMLCCNESD